MAHFQPKIDTIPDERLSIVLFPWTSLWCIAFSVLTLAATLILGSMGGINQPWAEPIDDVAWHARAAVLLVFSAAIMETGFLVTGMISATIMDSSMQGFLTQHSALDSTLTLVMYLCKIITAVYLWTIGGPVHTDSQAWGGPRPVFVARFVQWGVAVPLLVLISNRSFLAEQGLKTTLYRSFPAMLLSFAYVWIAWVMEVTPLPWIRWTCLVICLAGFVFASIDQIVIAFQCRGASLFKMKMAMLIYQLASFTLYAILFMFGRFGGIGVMMEQHLYAYMDATIKVLQGAFLAFIRSWEDLQTIRRLWHEAQTATRDLDETLKQAYVPILGVDLDGNITHLNVTMVKLCGLSQEEVLGRSIKDILTPESHAPFDDAMARAKEPNAEASGLVEVSTIYFPPPDLRDCATSEHQAKHRNLLLNLVPRRKHDVGLYGIVALGQDLTLLAHMKAVEEKKSRLMSVVSHELRSPLHGMIGLAGMMVDVLENETHRKQMGMVRSCACRLLDLVTNVMGLAENAPQEQGQVPKPTISLNWSEIAAEVMLMTRLAVDKANKPLVNPGVQLINHIGDMTKIPVVLGDPYKCTQLLYNLTTNACKFTRQGSVSLSAEHIKESSCLNIMVTDTGIGVSEEARERIFKPFEQEHGHGGDARAFQGVGLGLSVVMEIVKLHEGTINVRSKVGEGSTFTVSLPCKNDEFCEVFKDVDAGERHSEANAPEVTKPAERSGVSRAEPRLQPPKRERPQILSVDDDPVNQEAVKNALSKAYEVIPAMDGHAALEFLTAAHTRGDAFPDIVLLNIQMPGLTAYKVCKHIREEFEARESPLPIIMLFVEEPSCVPAIQGFDSRYSDIVVKPFGPKALSEKVAVALSRKEEAKGPDPTRPTLPELTLLAQLTCAQADCREATSIAETAERRLREVEQQLTTKSDALEVQTKCLDEAERVRSEHQMALKAATDQVQQQAEQLRKHEENQKAQAKQLREHEETQKAQAEALEEMKRHAGKEQVHQQAQQQVQKQAQQQSPLSHMRLPSPTARRGEGLRHRRHTPPGAKADGTLDSRCAEHMELMEAKLCVEELAARDAEIMELRDELARHAATNRLVASQLSMYARMSTQVQHLLALSAEDEVVAKTFDGWV